MNTPDSRTGARLRREPPRFRRLEVRRTERLGARLVLVTLGGIELEGLAIDRPASSVRILLPEPGRRTVVLPSWNGNEYLLSDGNRPVIRTLTPRRLDTRDLELDVLVVIHGLGAAAQWAGEASPGDEVALSGPGRGYVVEPDAPAYFLAGDETAIAAMSQLLETIPADKPVTVRIETAVDDASIPVPAHPGAEVRWCPLPEGAASGEELIRAVADAQIVDGARIWVAGEAASVQRIRRHLFEERAIPRAHAAVRGYWKRGKSASADGTESEL
jgi:NADPH-dependent ferric siderophore reductase